ncbi:MAG TPA: hypothetical protein PLL90_11060 [Bacteroidales bacterium]|jgi:hypothetical protein|nr:hypothetical protein [Bacteroidales bacterium]
MEAAGCRIIEYPDKDAEFSIYDIADQHLLNRGSSISHILKDRDRIAEDDYALWFCGGDYFDAIYPGDGRFDAEAFDEDLKINDLATLAATAVNIFCDIYLPIRDKCLGILLGNHEQKAFVRGSQMFVHSELCDKMNAPNMRYSGFTDLYFVHKPNRRKVRLSISYTPPEKFTAKLRVFIHHGMGAANTAGGKINKLKSLVDMVDADLVMMSHVHEQFAKAFLRLTPNFNCTEIGQRVTMGLITGSYLKTYTEGFTGYGEIAGYSPTTLGATRARYNPNEMTLIVENRGDNVGVKGCQL